MPPDESFRASADLGGNNSKGIVHDVGLIAVPERPVSMELSENVGGGVSSWVSNRTTGRINGERIARLRGDMGRRRIHNPII